MGSWEGWTKWWAPPRRPRQPCHQRSNSKSPTGLAKKHRTLAKHGFDPLARCVHRQTYVCVHTYVCQFVHEQNGKRLGLQRHVILVVCQSNEVARLKANVVHRAATHAESMPHLHAYKCICVLTNIPLRQTCQTQFGTPLKLQGARALATPYLTSDRECYHYSCILKRCLKHGDQTCYQSCVAQ